MRSELYRPRVLHILPLLGVAGAEQMAANLMVPLSRTCQVGAVGLYAASGSVTECALQRAGIPFWTLNKRPGLDPQMFSAVNRVIRDFKPDIVHTHLYVLRYSLPAVMWHRVPVSVHTLHNLAERENDAAGRLIQKIAFRRWVVPVAVSRNVARSIEQVYGVHDAVTIPNGVPIHDFSGAPEMREEWRRNEGFDNSAIVLIATGRLSKQKNPGLLLKAFSQVQDQRARLVFVGDGPMRHEIRRQVASYGISDRVRLLGYRTDVNECLAAGDIFVLSSDWEGNPLGVMEAMASGLPVVATNVGGVPELVDPGRQGILVPPGDVNGLANAMSFLIERTDVRIAMGNAARERAVAQFGLDRMVEAYDRLYTDLLSASPESSRWQQVTP